LFTFSFISLFHLHLQLSAKERHEVEEERRREVDRQLHEEARRKVAVAF
jgi:hypothetical protein